MNGGAFSRIALAIAAGLLLLFAPAASADPLFNPDPLEFADQLVGTSSTTLTVTVTNDSTSPPRCAGGASGSPARSGSPEG